MNTRLITTSDIESILLRIGINPILDRLIAKLRSGFQSLDRNTANIPVRSGLYYRDPDLGLLEWMPAKVDAARASLKIVGYHPANPRKRMLPTILSTICIFDTTTGHMIGMLDGTFTTALRTGAMSAVASAALAPYDRDLTLGLIGCGAQAVTQAHALSRVLPIKRILAYDRDFNALKTYPQRVAFLNLNVQEVQRDRLPEAISACDLLCTCTSESPGEGPVFADGPHKSDLHINAVGSDFPGKTEVPLSLLQRSLVIPDFREQALAEGECQQLSPDTVSCDLANLLNAPQLQSEGRAGLSVFDSTGHAYSDYLTGLMFLEYAEEMSLGSPVEIECSPPDPRDPYSFLSTECKAELFIKKSQEVKG